MTTTKPTEAVCPATGHRRAAGVGLIALSAASFGVMPVLTKVVYRDGAEPVGVLAVRFSCAAVLLSLLVAVTRPPGRTVRTAGRPTLVALLLLGAIGYAGQSSSYFAALTHASAGLVALLLYVYPALVVGLVALLYRERPRTVTVICLLVAVVGTGLTLGPIGGGQITGALLALLAAIFYAVYIVTGSRITPRLGPLRSTAVIMVGAAATLLCWAGLTGPRLPSSAGGWLALSAVVVVCTVVAPWSFFAGLARVGPADASTISTLEPVVSVLLGVLVLGERLAGIQIAGAVLVLGAVVLLARLGGREVPPRLGE
ncbi:MAG: DMT family transporter [Actinomycetota bacterium]|nr:DMT family transporter [Actinomycetota bacterium]